MRALTATIAGNDRFTPGLSRLTLAAPSLAAATPGQCLALRPPGALLVVPRPFSLAAIDRRAGTVDLLYDDGDPLAPWLTSLVAGSPIDLLGPWGRPWPVDTRARHAVLLGSGRSLVALLSLARSLVEAGVAVVVLHDAPTAGGLLPPVALPPAAELHIATADGSAGVTGGALDVLPPLLSWADALYAALPMSEHAPLRDLVHRHRLRARRGFASVLAEAPLACYAGACDGCAVPLRDGGYGLLCKDGPVFDLLELL